MNLKQKSQHMRGFTIIEMIVVIAIIAVVTTLVLFNNARLNSNILVSNAAYEIGLIVRESQVAGLGVKSSTDGEFTSSHGVHIEMSTPDTVTMFADINDNGVYDAADGEMTQQYVMNNSRSGTIIGLCTSDTLSPITSIYCTDINTKASLDVVFKRPNPEAFFKTRLTATDGAVDYVGSVVINVGFVDDICRSVIIQKTGAVEINQNNCVPMTQ